MNTKGFLMVSLAVVVLLTSIVQPIKAQDVPSFQDDPCSISLEYEYILREWEEITMFGHTFSIPIGYRVVEPEVPGAQQVIVGSTGPAEECFAVPGLIGQDPALNEDSLEGEDPLVEVQSYNKKRNPMSPILSGFIEQSLELAEMVRQNLNGSYILPFLMSPIYAMEDFFASLKPQPERIPVAAKDLKSLEKYVGHSRPIPGFPEDKVRIVKTPAGEQVWVDPNWDGYDDAYKAVKGKPPEKWAIDHVYARQRAGQQGYKWVRLEAIPEGVNSSAGAGWEKKSLELGRRGFVEPRGIPEIRYAAQNERAKLAHIRPGGKYNNYAGLRQLGLRRTPVSPPSMIGGLARSAAVQAGQVAAVAAAAYLAVNYGEGIGNAQVAPGVTVKDFWGDRLTEMTGNDFWYKVGGAIDNVTYVYDLLNKYNPVTGPTVIFNQWATERLKAITPEPVKQWVSNTTNKIETAIEDAGQAYGQFIIDNAQYVQRDAEKNGGGLVGYAKAYGGYVKDIWDWVRGN